MEHNVWRYLHSHLASNLAFADWLHGVEYALMMLHANQYCELMQALSAWKGVVSHRSGGTCAGCATTIHISNVALGLLPPIAYLIVAEKLADTGIITNNCVLRVTGKLAG
jgi:hypothetical protein